MQSKLSIVILVQSNQIFHINPIFTLESGKYSPCEYIYIFAYLYIYLYSVSLINCANLLVAFHFLFNTKIDCETEVSLQFHNLLLEN
jgi:hypothetical protein